MSYLHQLLSKVSITTTLLTLSIAVILTTFVDLCHGHGRLIEPPSRSSAWRYGFQTPPNYNDHELYCGGFTRQQRNGGKCGECGDPFDAPEPRANEYGGRYGQGVVVRKYNPGSEITLRVELTASHMGYVERHNGIEQFLWIILHNPIVTGTLNSGCVRKLQRNKSVWINMCWSF